MRKSTWFLGSAFLAGLIASSNLGHARDLGAIGPSYGIRERDLIEVIHERLATYRDSGLLDQHRQELTARSRHSLNRPRGVQLPRTDTYRERRIDLTFTTKQDITDQKGHVLYPAGTRVNPLHYQSLTTILCFADGDDPEQVTWLAATCADPLRTKLILVRGNYTAIAAQLGRRLYFDQHAHLVQRLDIQALPAIVRQKETALYVEEYPLH